jgi:phage antirepressor YoqD-like protein
MAVPTLANISVTSAEIAELVGSRHDHVKTSIERLANQGVITFPASREKSSTGGRPGTEYLFVGERGKRDSIIVVAQLSPQFTARLVDRWQELELRVASPDPIAMLNDPETLRTLLLGYGERVLSLEHQVQEQAPKVAALDRIAGARGAHCLTDTAKALQVRRSDLIAWMQEHSWIYKRPGTAWLPYQPRVQAGLLVLKVVARGEAEEARLFDQTLVTPKGLARLGELMAKERRSA